MTRQQINKQAKEILEKALSYYGESEFTEPKEIIIATGWLKQHSVERISRALAFITL